MTIQAIIGTFIVAVLVFSILLFIMANHMPSNSQKE